MLAVIVAGIAALPACAAADGGSITASTIGGAKLGDTATSYRRLLGRPFSSRLGDGRTQLMFKGGDVLVYLGASGRGISITTADSSYKTATGIGPCSPMDALRRTYGKRLRPKRLKGHTEVAAYRVGHLLFTITPANTIGAVALATTDLPLSAIINGGQCGQSEEGE